MSVPRHAVYFDFIDPLSYLLATELDALDPEESAPFVWHPFELRPPPTPLVRVDDPTLSGRWARARRLGAERGIVFDPPDLVPWTRKAHELVLLGDEHEKSAALRDAIFRAHLLEGSDIGRVDVLVEIAVDLGLPRTETRAVLDVDTHRAAVAASRADAASQGISDTPTLLVGDRRVEGFHNRDALGTLLRS
ncbi:MAG: DsbA family protein [Longimicrobiales bacterium]|nr:DsbA family protein [Longimicrobiales bacterium]